MRQTPLHLDDKDRQLIESYRSKGRRYAREVNRAHILSALDHGISEAQIMAVLGVGRSVVWRTRAAYLEGGADYALHDIKRSGKPRKYGSDVEAHIAALVCAAPPPGANYWTIKLIKEAVQAQAGIEAISRETVRRLVNKTVSSQRTD